MLQTCYKKDNSYDNYGAKGSSGQEQEHLGKLKFIDNVSIKIACPWRILSIVKTMKTQIKRADLFIYSI